MLVIYLELSLLEILMQVQDQMLFLEQVEQIIYLILLILNQDLQRDQRQVLMLLLSMKQEVLLLLDKEILEEIRLQPLKEEEDDIVILLHNHL